MTAKELKEEAYRSWTNQENGYTQECYTFNPNEMDIFCKQLCKEQREKCVAKLVGTDKYSLEFVLSDDEDAFNVFTAPEPEL